MDAGKKICRQCILHSRVPDVTIGEDDLCVFCRINTGITPEMMRQNTAMQTGRMEAILEQAKRLKRPYDVMVYFSGGKDSTYVLNLMKTKYDMNVLAFSMIQPFVTDLAQRNMEAIVKKLNVEALKFFMDERVYKGMLAYSIRNGRRYGLTEWVGCEVCGFLTKWVGMKIAMNLGIPVVIDGMDHAQSGSGGIVEGDKVKMKMKNGRKPYGKIHDLFDDALGAGYKNSIYGYDGEEMAKRDYPTLMSPLCFMEYDPTFSFNRLENMGISFKQFKSLNTNCELLYLLDYVSMRRYDCDSYIKLYASGLRQNYDTIEQLELDQKEHKKRLTREDMLALLGEYKDVLYYVIDHDLDPGSITEPEKEKLMSLIRFSRETFGEETLGKLLERVLKMRAQAEYFGLDLKNIN